MSMMGTEKLFCLAGVTLILSVISLPAQVPAGRAPTDEELSQTMPVQVGVFVEFIAADTALVEGLLYKHRDATSDRALRSALEEHLSQGTAKVSEMAYVIAASGSEAKIESVVERIYPTEFDPPEVVKEIQGPVSAADRITTPATPTAFTTRSTGLTITVKPWVSPERSMVEMDIRVDGVEYMGDDVHGKGPATVATPKFFSRQIDTNIFAPSGSDFLLGVVKPGPEAAVRELIFIRPTVLLTTTIEDARGRWLLAQGKEEERTPAEERAEAKQVVGPIGNIVTLVEHLEVPLAELHPRMRQPMASLDATALRVALDPLIESGAVKRTAMSYLTTRRDQRARVALGNERIYGAEMDPPELPAKLEVPGGAADAVVPGHLTVYEMRAEGLTVEGRAGLGSDGETIRLRILPEWVRRVGSNRHGQREAEIVFPLFHTNRLLTDGVATLAGNYVLLGLHSTRSESGRNTGTYTLVFATCSRRNS